MIPTLLHAWHVVMDRQVINGLKVIVDCSRYINDAQVAATAAMKASTSASIFYAEGYTALSISRVNRTEQLLISLRNSLRLFDGQVDIFNRKIFDVTQLQNRRKATWNKLSDEWWQERAKAIVERLSNVKIVQSQVSNALDVAAVTHDPTEPSYEQIITTIKDAVNTLRDVWNNVESFINEWKDIAVAVFEGIGESGSLIPT